MTDTLFSDCLTTRCRLCTCPTENGHKTNPLYFSSLCTETHLQTPEAIRLHTVWQAQNWGETIKGFRLLTIIAVPLIVVPSDYVVFAVLCVWHTKIFFFLPNISQYSCLSRTYFSTSQNSQYCLKASLIPGHLQRMDKGLLLLFM